MLFNKRRVALDEAIRFYEESYIEYATMLKNSKVAVVQNVCIDQMRTFKDRIKKINPNYDFSSLNKYNPFGICI